MNLCLINPSISERPEIYALARHLPQKYNIVILQPSNKSGRDDNAQLAENICIKYIQSNFIHLSNSIITVPSFDKWVKQLSNLVKSKVCDLIHVCDYEYLTSILPLIIKHKYGIPAIIVNDAILGIDYSFGTFSADFLAKIYSHTLGKWILDSYDKIIFLHSKLAQQAIKLGISQKKIVVIPNGIDSSEMLNYKKTINPDKIKEKYRIKNNQKVILYVGRLVKLKRVEIIIDVIRELLNKNINVVGLIVGDGPQRLNLEKRAKILGVKNSIVFTGYIPEEEKYECYSIADLFILPSISEGLPTVLLEAASFRLPIIATNTGGIPDIVVHNRTGFLVNKWDYDQYVKYAELLLTNPSLAVKIAENGNKYVKSNFSWDKIVEKYEKVYNELILI